MDSRLVNQFVEEVKRTWGPVSTEVVEQTFNAMNRLAQNYLHSSELAEFLNGEVSEKELIRDSEHEFILLQHREQPGQYRAPHDHGSGWVIYAVVSGQVEMRTYKQVTSQKGKTELVKRDTRTMQAGDINVYLPGDIHDTRAVAGSAVMLRFSSVDLKKEFREGRMIRYSVEAGS